VTACSNHPGTPAGLALAELLGEVETVVAAIRQAELRWCKASGISRSHWLELRAMQDKNGA
jgi:hypothetical protein